MKGRIRDILPIGNKAVISLEIDAKAGDIEKYSGKELNVDMEPYSSPRTRSQNAYYWKLLSIVVAHKDVRISAARKHNELLRRHPKFATIGGRMVTTFIPDTDEAENDALESDTFHIRPTTHITAGSNGTAYRMYHVLKGSKDYTVDEMGVLLDDLIEDAKELDIDVRTPEEIEKMRYYDRMAEERKRGT